MTLTGHRTFQYVGILLALSLIAGGYWYFAVRAGVKTNTSGSQPQGIGDLSAGLAGYWKLDDGSGTTATDASVNGNNGTLTNGPTWGTGRIGGSVVFDGTNDYVNIPNSSALALTTDGTFCVWFNAVNYSVTYGALMKKDLNYILRTNDDNGGLGFRWWDGTNNVFMGTTHPSTGAWHHLCGVVSANVPTGLYLDGALVTTATSTSANARNTSNVLTLGARDGGTEAFNGQIDEIRVYSRALSGDEVANLYRLTAPTGVDTSLKGYWSFDGGALSGTTAYDRSGAGNNGTLTNGPTVAVGRVGQALNFDGSDDYVLVPDANTLDFSSSHTMSSWVKWTATPSGTDEIVGKAATGTQGNYYMFRNGGLICGLTYSGGTESNHSAGVSLETGKWYHFACVFDDTGNTYKMYIDGLEVKSEAETHTPDTGAGNVNIGRSARWVGDQTVGVIDEVRLYSRALSAGEIKSLYDRGAADKTNTSATQAQGTGRLDSGLIGYWKLDENTGTSVADGSVNANAATLTNGPAWVTGRIGSAADFDGSNDYAITSSRPAFAADHSQAVMSAFAWVYPQATTFEFQTVVSFGEYDDSQYAAGLGLYQSGLNVVYMKDGNDAPYADSGLTVPLNQWSFIGYSNAKDSASGNITTTFFVNGATSAVTETFNGNIDSTDPFLIGASGHNAVLGGYFNGYLDEVRVYDRAVSTDEMRQLYNVTTPTGTDTSLKGYWSFNGSDINGTTAYDRSGAGNNGTLTNGPATKWGRVGQALDFDGSNDYVSYADNIAFNSSDFTVSGWVRRDGTGGGTDGTNVIFSQRISTTGAGNPNVTLYLDASHRPALQIRDNVGSAVTINGPAATAVGQWVHVVGVKTATEVRLYADSALVVSATHSLSGDFDAGATIRTIGKTNYDTTDYGFFNGVVDEVRVYTRALTAAEVKAQYDAAAPDKTNTSVSTPQGTGRLDSGLIGYWKLDENTGTSAADATSAGTTGTLTGGPTWTTGRIGTGVDFDGTNDYIDLGTPAVLDVEGAHTVSAWVKTDVTNTDQAIFTSGTAGCCGSEIFLLLDHNGGGGYYDFLFGNGGSGFIDAHNTGDPDVQAGTWYHVVGTWDGRDVRRLYVNGVLRKSDSISALVEYADLAKIGASEGGVQFWNGAIDEVRVYNRALSADEVAQLYSVTAPTGTDTSLRGYWSFNGQDMSGTTAYDRSGAGNDGALANGPTVKWGKIGQALQFDGTDDYVDMGDINAIDGLTTITAMAWIKTTASGERHFFDKSACTGYAGSGTFEMMTGGFVANKASFVVLPVGGSPANYVNVDSAVDVTDGVWHHVAGTYDGTTMRIYVDGVQSGTTALSGVTLASVSATVQVGGDCNAHGGLFWSGGIDEARVYNRALSASEIQALYNSGR